MFVSAIPFFDLLNLTRDPKRKIYANVHGTDYLRCASLSLLNETEKLKSLGNSESSQRRLGESQMAVLFEESGPRSFRR